MATEGRRHRRWYAVHPMFDTGVLAFRHRQERHRYLENPAIFMRMPTGLRSTISIRDNVHVQIIPASGFCSFSICIGCIIIRLYLLYRARVSNLWLSSTSVPSRRSRFRPGFSFSIIGRFPSLDVHFHQSPLHGDRGLSSSTMMCCPSDVRYRNVGAIGIWRTPLFSRGCSSTGLRSTCSRLEPRYFDADALPLAISSSDISSVT